MVAVVDSSDRYRQIAQAGLDGRLIAPLARHNLEAAAALTAVSPWDALDPSVCVAGRRALGQKAL